MDGIVRDDAIGDAVIRDAVVMDVPVRDADVMDIKVRDDIDLIDFVAQGWNDVSVVMHCFF